MTRRLCLLGIALVIGSGCGTPDVPIRSSDPVASLSIDPERDTLQPSDAILLRGVPRNSRGQALADRGLRWTSTSPSIAHVSEDGIVSALAPGVAQIVATAEGRTASATITVVPLKWVPGECAAPRPGWIWCDDFDQDRLANYSEYEGRESFVRTPGIGYGGTPGMRAIFVRDQVGAGVLHVHFGKVPGADFRPVDAGTEMYRDVYWRVFVRYAPNWIGGGAAKMSRAQSLAPHWAQAMIAHVWAPSETLDRLAIEPASGVGFAGRLLTTEYNDFPNLAFGTRAWSDTPIFDRRHVGKWYCVEARARLNDPGRSNGVFELWIDDRHEARLSGLGWIGRFQEYGINAVYLENYWNEGAPQVQSRDFDNFIISRQRIGCR